MRCSEFIFNDLWSVSVVLCTSARNARLVFVDWVSMIMTCTHIFVSNELMVTPIRAQTLDWEMPRLSAGGIDVCRVVYFRQDSECDGLTLYGED